MKLHRKTLPCLLCLCAAITPLRAAIVGIDNDRDGMSDVWETYHKFATYDDGTLYPEQAPSSDPDGDGQTNLQEASAGTDPWSGVALVGFVRPKIINVGPDFTVSWFGKLGKEYSLGFSSNLGNPWVAIGTPYLGDDELIEYVANIGGNQPFLRVDVGDSDLNDDGIGDFEAFLLDIDPEETDADGDDMPDKWEFDHFGNLAAGKFDDPDGDGVSNYDEYLAGSNPLDMDSDGDGVPDDEDPDHEALDGEDFNATDLMVISPLN